MDNIVTFKFYSFASGHGFHMLLREQCEHLIMNDALFLKCDDKIIGKVVNILPDDDHAIEIKIYNEYSSIIENIDNYSVGLFANAVVKTGYMTNIKPVNITHCRLLNSDGTCEIHKDEL
jgi:hypothetical protein